MYSRNECIEKILNNAAYIRTQYGVESLCLFGSVARGDNNESSDIDLLVQMPPKALKMVALKDFLQQLLGVSVDLVRRHANLSPFFSKEIARDGILIF